MTVIVTDHIVTQQFSLLHSSDNNAAMSTTGTGKRRTQYSVKNPDGLRWWQAQMSGCTCMRDVNSA